MLTGHCYEMAHFLQSLHNLVFVLGEDAGEAVGAQDCFIDRAVVARRLVVSLDQILVDVHGVTHTQSSACFFGNFQLITGDHLHSNA